MSFPYEAEFECPKGHRFNALVLPTEIRNNKVRCPHCFEEWVAANVLDAEQVSDAKPVMAEQETTYSK